MLINYLKPTKFLLISLFCFSQTSFISHKFYVSVTDVEYKIEEKAIQIISRVFVDDFEDVLGKRFSIPIVLLPDEESKNADQWISRYINQKLNIEIQGKEVQLNFIGKRYEDDRIYLYIEAENIPDFNSISVENLILTDLFEEQKNLVHFKKNKKLKSIVLTKSKSKHTFTY